MQSLFSCWVVGTVLRLGIVPMMSIPTVPAHSLQLSKLAPPLSSTSVIPDSRAFSSPLLWSNVILLSPQPPKNYHPNSPYHLRSIPEFLPSSHSTQTPPLFPAPGPESVHDQTNKTPAPLHSLAQLHPPIGKRTETEWPWSPLCHATRMVCTRKGAEF